MAGTTIKKMKRWAADDAKLEAECMTRSGKVAFTAEFIAFATEDSG